jgi:hypothetical protein
MSVWRLNVCVLVALLGSASWVPAQGLESSQIIGTILDPSGAVLAGATVTLSGPTVLGEARSQSTDERGRYRFPSLLPGTFSVRAESAGFVPTTRQGVVLALSTSATIDMTLTIASVTDAVRVSSTGQVVDVNSSSIVTTLDEHLLQALPTLRNLSQILALAPGVFNPTSVPGLVVAFGGTVGANGLYVDGVDVTEPRTQSALLAVSQNWLDQVQITALGADARYGDFAGAISNAVLRSGAGRPHALLEYWTTHWKWIDRNGSSLAGREILAFWDASAQAGGPLRANRLWYFTGIEYFRREDRPLNFDGDSRAQHAPRGVVKLTGAFAGDGRLEGHLQGNSSETRAANAGPFTATDALNHVSERDTSWNVRVSKPLGPKTLFEARYGGYVSTRAEDPLAPRTRDNPSPIVDGRILRGNSNVYQDNNPLQFDIDGTLARDVDGARTGPHEVRLGLDLDWNRSVVTQGFPGGQRSFVQSGRLTDLAQWSGDRTEGHGFRTAMYAQDRWRPKDWLTLNLGLRLDLNRGSVPSVGTVLSTNVLSPRMGAAWSIDRSRSTVLKAHGGRYYDALLTNRVAFMDVDGIGQTIGFQPSPSGELVEVFRSAPPGARAIDPNIKHPYVDQYVLGIERRIRTHGLLQVHGIRRDFEQIMAMTDTGSRWTPVQLRDPGVDGALGTGDDGQLFEAFRQVNPGEQYLFYTNPPGAFRRYTALQAVYARRWTGTWQLQASYTLSRTAATIGNGDFTNAGLNDTGEQTGTRTPSVYMNPNGGINAEGRAVFDKNEFKVLGSYRLPVFSGVNIGGVLWRQDGNRWERTITYFGTLIPGAFQTIKLEPRGSRVTDAVWNLDVRIEPTVRIPFGGGSLGLAFDVLNATNQGTPLSLDGSVGRGFGTPITRSDPRTLRVLARWRR